MKEALVADVVEPRERQSRVIVEPEADQWQAIDLTAPSEEVAVRHVDEFGKIAIHAFRDVFSPDDAEHRG